VVKKILQLQHWQTASKINVTTISPISSKQNPDSISHLNFPVVIGYMLWTAGVSKHGIVKVYKSSRFFILQSWEFKRKKMYPISQLYSPRTSKTGTSIIRVHAPTITGATMGPQNPSRYLTMRPNRSVIQGTIKLHI